MTRKVTGRILTGGIAMETGRPGSRSEMLLRRISRRCIPSLILCKTDRKESMQWVVQHLKLRDRQQADITPTVTTAKTLVQADINLKAHIADPQYVRVLHVTNIRQLLLL